MHCMSRSRSSRLCHAIGVPAPRNGTPRGHVFSLPTQPALKSIFRPKAMIKTTMRSSTFSTFAPIPTRRPYRLCVWSRSWVDVDTLGNVPQATLDILKIRNFKNRVSEQLGIAPEDVIFDTQDFVVPPQHMYNYIRLLNQPRPQPQLQQQPQQRQTRRKNVRSLAALQQRLREESNPQRREGLLRQIAKVKQWSRIKIEDALRSPSPTPSIQHSRSSSATPSVSDDPHYPLHNPHAHSHPRHSRHSSSRKQERTFQPSARVADLRSPSIRDAMLAPSASTTAKKVSRQQVGIGI
ncbi:hypothetical protein A4X06_0g7250 [Tilletia controversa]|uniref:Uncharacterized protein n=1 Tax=Tilletia controversa TaxID=13291 RepID=A0A8X7STV6_9BASI|nr:hypothetical protein A4X06_0g7250 [Tilletia controversa]